MRKRLAWALLLLAAPLWAAKPFPPSPPSYVHNEGVLSPAAEHRLSVLLRGVEERTGHQFVAALFQSLDSESLEDYSNRLFRAWKIGAAKRDDGLLFCLFQKDRLWRVEVGYGLEHVITDLEAGEIARREGVPFFKKGDFDSGVLAVAEGLAAKLEGTARALPHEAEAAPEMPLHYLLLPLILLFIFLSVLNAIYGVNTFGSRSRSSSSSLFGDGWGSGGGWGGGGGFGGGGFSGGGGSSGGGGASGSW